YSLRRRRGIALMRQVRFSQIALQLPTIDLDRPDALLITASQGQRPGDQNGVKTADMLFSRASHPRPPADHSDIRPVTTFQEHSVGPEYKRIGTSLLRLAEGRPSSITASVGPIEKYRATSARWGVT